MAAASIGCGSNTKAYMLEWSQHATVPAAVHAPTAGPCFPSISHQAPSPSHLAPAPAARPASQVTDPYLKLFSGLVPPLLGSIDLTPLLGFFILQFLAGALDVADDESKYW